jgi:uncharacterized membrane protein YuzA (DUF378 family)
MKTIRHPAFVSSDVEPLSEEVGSPTMSRYASARAIVANVFLPFLAIRLLLMLVGLATIYYIIPLINRKQPIVADNRLSYFPDMLYLMWVHFDSGFYLTIAHDGYWSASTLHTQSNWGFFPLYPLVIRLIALPFGSAWSAYQIVGIIVSNIAALIAAFYLYKLTTKEFNNAAATRAVYYLGLFPMSFYLSAIYSESLFLALSIGCIYYVRLRRWWLAGLLGALATLTRSSGVLLVVAFAWEYWNVLGDKFAPLTHSTGFVPSTGEWLRSRFIGLWHSLSVWRTWSGFVALALVPVTLLLFMVYSKWKVGTYTAYFTAQHYGWNHSLSNPILLVLDMLHHPSPATPYDWNFYSLNMISTLIFICLLVPVFRKLPAIYGIVMLAFIVLPLTTGKMDSVTRYYLTLFPVYMLLAWWSSQGTQEQQLRRHGLITVSCTILLSLGMVLFTLGVYSIA